MGDHRLKVRIGDHEFEAEGSEESVERQFALWKELVAEAVTKPEPVAMPSPPPPSSNGGAVPTASTEGTPAIERVFRREGPVVTLTLPPHGQNREAEAGLLVLLGHRLLLSEDAVTGSRLMQGLARSGVAVERVDRMFGDYMPSYVMRGGARRGVRYRLTNLGVSKAQEIARELVSQVL